MDTPRFSCRCRISEVRAHAYTAAESQAYINRQCDKLLAAMATILVALFLHHAYEAKQQEAKQQGPQPQERAHSRFEWYESNYLN